MNNTSEIDNDDLLSIFPNPTGSIVNVCYSSSQKENLIITVRNTMGQIVYKNEYHLFCGELKEAIDIGRNARGVYFVEVLNGNDRSIKKLVLQ